MDKREKLQVLDKLLRELEDLKNSETSLVKKLGQLETDNINLSDKTLEKGLPEIFQLLDDALNKTTELHDAFSESRNKFVKDNKLDEVVESVN
ncbi:MAG TPA: hypothetical protein VK625_01705 [Flavitalea sp.]|nr:hypothetical protein [Flavitalea sp.]